MRSTRASNASPSPTRRAAELPEARWTMSRMHPSIQPAARPFFHRQPIEKLNIAAMRKIIPTPQLRQASSPTETICSIERYREDRPRGRWLIMPTSAQSSITEIYVPKFQFKTLLTQHSCSQYFKLFIGRNRLISLNHSETLLVQIAKFYPLRAFWTFFPYTWTNTDHSTTPVLLRFFHFSMLQLLMTRCYSISINVLLSCTSHPSEDPNGSSDVATSPTPTWRRDEGGGRKKFLHPALSLERTFIIHMCRPGAGVWVFIWMEFIMLCRGLVRGVVGCHFRRLVWIMFHISDETNVPFILHWNIFLRNRLKVRI